MKTMEQVLEDVEYTGNRELLYLEYLLENGVYLKTYKTDDGRVIVNAWRNYSDFSGYGNNFAEALFDLSGWLINE